MRLIISLFICSYIIFTGCSISPIPDNISILHESTKNLVPILTDILEEGDMVFRIGRAQVAGGKINFSRLVADLAESDFSHASLVYRKIPEGVIMLDVGIMGLERKFLNDWLMAGSENIVVKRLSQDHRHLLPDLMYQIDKIIEEDGLYDEKFVSLDDKYYCTEVVDHCFRAIGQPLATKNRIMDLPGYSVIHWLACSIAKINPQEFVVVAGNDNIGLFSSPLHETIADFRQ